MTDEPNTKQDSTPTEAKLPPPLVFISYATGDQKYVDALMEFFAASERSHVLRLWVSSQLPPGEPWRVKLDTALQECEIAIFVFTARFLSRDFPHLNEIPVLLARNPRPRLFPVVFRPCPWEDDDELEKLQVWNGGQAVHGVDNDPEADERLKRLARDVAQFARTLRPGACSETPPPSGVVNRTPTPAPITKPTPVTPTPVPARTSTPVTATPVPASEQTPETAGPPSKGSFHIKFAVLIGLLVVVTAVALLMRASNPVPDECADLMAAFTRIDGLGPTWRATLNSEGKMQDFVQTIQNAESRCQSKCKTVEAVHRVVTQGMKVRLMCTSLPDGTIATQ